MVTNTVDSFECVVPGKVILIAARQRNHKYVGRTYSVRAKTGELFLPTQNNSKSKECKNDQKPKRTLNSREPVTSASRRLTSRDVAVP